MRRYAFPIDCAAANGHYDLVRDLLRIDNNHLFKLTSLRRICRIELVWDDEEQFNGVAKCRSEVVQKLLLECESKRGKNSLIRAGYGGWLMYIVASAGDLGFVQQLLERNPLLVFGEEEYNVSDIFYAASKRRIVRFSRCYLITHEETFKRLII
ncbi:Ankyrin repeat-containing domain superfamily [Sesbania bispinosa]|nr:Ankyrin repeat-containing domain superfamily [Sesbania bispinosa]